MSISLLAQRTGRLRRLGITWRPAIILDKYDDWNGAYITEKMIQRFCKKTKLNLDRIIGQETQYMWVTGRKL